MAKSAYHLVAIILFIMTTSLLLSNTNAATLASVGVESATRTVSATTTLSLYSTTITSINAGGRFEIIVPPTTSIASGSLSCTMIEPPTISVSCNGVAPTRTITVTLSGALPGGTFFQINIQGFTNPDSTLTTSTFEFRTYSSTGTLLDSKTSGIFLTATSGTLTAASISPTDPTVAASNTINVSITTTHRITRGGSIRITMPKWNPNSPNAPNILSMIQGSYVWAALQNLDSTISCTFSSSTDTLVVSNAFPNNDIAAGTVIRFSCSGFRNPISTATKTGFTVATYSGDGGMVDSTTTTVKVSSPATIVSGTISSLESKIVQTLTVMRVTFPSPVPLDQGCIVDIQFPASLPITATDLSNVRGVGLFGTSRTMTTSINVNSRIVTITNGWETYVSPDFDAILEFTRVSNPLSTMPTESLSISIKDKDGNAIASRSADIRYIATSGTMNSATLSATPTVIGSSSALTVNLYPSHKIVTQSALKITFPTQVSLPAGTWTLSNLNLIQSSATWAMSGQVLRIGNPFSSDYIPVSATSSTIRFTVNSITMPGTTAPTSTYIFESAFVSGGVDYIIDQSSYSNMLTATFGTIASATVTPTSSVANALTTYTFAFDVTHTIVRDAKIVINFPSEIILPSPATSANSCTAISGIDATLICTATSNSLTVNGGYSSASRPAGTRVSFSITQVRNPVSLQPTSSFSIRTRTQDDYDIDVVTSGVLVTMAAVNSLTSVEITPESLVNGATTTLEIKIVASSPLKNGDLLRVTFPTQVKTPTGSVTWAGITALSATLTCSKVSTTPEIIQVVLNFASTTSVDANELLKFNINQIQNPPTTQPTDTFGFLFMNANGFNINTYSGITRVTTTEAAELLTTGLLPSSTVALADVNIQFTFTLAHSFPGTGIIYIYYPARVTLKTASLSCQWVDTSVTPATSTCTCAQQTVSGETRIILRNAFASGLSAGKTVRVTINGFVNPELSEVTNSFKIQTYTAETGGFKIDKKETGLTLSVQCNYPCLTCGASKSSCNSCITTLAAYKLQGNTWVLNCDEGKFYNSATNICEDCATECTACSTTDKNVCTKWGKVGYEFLHNGRCVNTCPSTFFGNAVTKTCDSCDTTNARWLNCVTTASTCTSCDTSTAYRFLHENVWVTSCPARTHIQDTTANAWVPWDSNCKEWSGTTTTCTVCNANMKLDLRTNKWVNDCETGKTIVSGSTWVAWNPNCLTCAGSTATCTSCPTGQVLTLSYTCGAACIKTNAIPVNGVCTEWDPTCTKCSGSISSCTECAINYALYNGRWVANCPPKYENQNRVCVYVGLVCPPNYEPNEAQDSCIPTIKTCPDGKILNSDQTKCIPPTGKVAPFPFLFVALWFLLVVIAGKVKDKSRSRIIGNLIPLLGLLETPAILILSITAALVEAWAIFAVALVAFFILVLLNVIMYILFRKHTMKDKDFQYYAKRYPKTADILPAICLIWNFRALKFFYSGFFGLDTCMLTLSNAEGSFMRYFRRIIIVCFIVVHIPVYAVSFYGLATLIWGYQALVECIEVPILLLIILILTIIEKRCEKARIEQDPYLPISTKNKFADDIAVMSAVPLHRSVTKDLNDEESKTENYSISIEAEKHYQRELDYDVELRKKALMSIVSHIKNPERRNSIFDDDRSLSNCTFFEEEKYESNQRRVVKRPPRRAFSFGGLKPIDEEEEFLLTEEESESDYRDRRFDKSPPKIQRRMSFPMRAEELEEVENPIFSEAIDEYRKTLRQQLDDNCYADSKPPKPIEIFEPPVMAEMGTQTMLRDLLFDQDSDEEFERIEYEEAELESDFAWNLIGEVIDNLSESSVYKEKKKVDADRLRDIPDFELEDILGEFDVDENGNFIINSEDGRLTDKNGKRVNRKGYFIDDDHNIINRKGEIIFYASEVGEDGEIPAPFVYEKHKADFLAKALQRKEGVTIDPDYMIDDDEDLVEAELKKLRPESRESSIESLVAENPGLYVEDNLMKGKKSIQISPNARIDSIQANKPKGKKYSPDRNSITDIDRELAKAYGGKAKGSIKSSYVGQPGRIKREDTRELFPSLAVENQAKHKLSKIAEGFSRSDKSKELRKQLEKLKQEHFRDIDSDDLGELNMDLIEQKIDDFDFQRQKQYEDKMKRHIESSMQNYNKPPVHTSSNFYQNRMPFQNSDLLTSGLNSRITTSKAQYNSRLDQRSKTKPLSGLRRIYGNLGELVVPAEERDHEQISKLHSPGSTITLRSGFSRQPTRSKFESNSRIRGLEMIYLQKLENRNKRENKTSQGQRKAKFRTLHNKFIDDPSILMHDDLNEVEELEI